MRGPWVDSVCMCVCVCVCVCVNSTYNNDHIYVLIYIYIYIYIYTLINSNFNNKILPYCHEDYRIFLIFPKLIPTTLSQLFFFHSGTLNILLQPLTSTSAILPEQQVTDQFTTDFKQYWHKF